MRFGVVPAFVIAAAAACAGKPSSSAAGPTTPTAPVVPTVVGLSISGTAPLVGTASQFTATARLTDGGTKNVSGDATWHSSAAAVATVSATGLVTGVSAGVAEISVNYQQAGTIGLRITVEPPAPGFVGQAVDAFTGAGVGGVAIHIDRVGDAVADANGIFRLPLPGSRGTFRLTASGSGIVERNTMVSVPGTLPALSVIPSSFPIDAFDNLRAFTTAGRRLTKWLRAPALVIETSIIERTDATNPNTDRTATATPASEQLIADTIARLTQVLPILTAGTFSGFASITRDRTPAGGAVPVGRPGAIHVLYGAVDNRGSPLDGIGGALFDPVTFEIKWGDLWLDPAMGSDRFHFVCAHEFGHAIGFSFHVHGVESLMSDAAVANEPTDFDRKAARLIYGRPPGNRAPDTDPDGYRVNDPATVATFIR